MAASNAGSPVVDPIFCFENELWQKLNKEEKAHRMLQISSEHRLRQENLGFDIDVWYPALKQFTFPTVFIPLTRTEARSIMNYYATRYLSRKGRLTTADVAVLRSLEEMLDKEIRNNFSKTGAFMRLCGRSVKDGEPLDRKAVQKQYSEVLAQLLEQGLPETANTKAMAVARTHWLKITNGAEAMSLLLSSERVFIDLRDWLEFGEPEQIVLRAWEDELRYDYEFRLFISRGQVTGISQYDHYVVYPHLEKMKSKLQRMLLEYWAMVHPHVGEDSYAMDLGYLDKSDKIVLIEISPFLHCTGAAMFRWEARFLVISYNKC